MRRELFYALLGLAVLLLVMNVYLTLNGGKVLDVKQLKADATVTDHIGFRLTNDSIMHFGSLVPDSGSSRKFTLSNNYAGPIFVKVYYSGMPWLSFSENNFILSDGQAMNITASVDVPKNASLGNYSWNISVVMQKAR